MDLGVCYNGKLLCCVANWEPVASLRHIHLCKCSIFISIWESHCHYLMLFQGLLLYQQQEGINSASVSLYCLLDKLYRSNMLCASVAIRVRWCGKLECIFSRQESRSRVAGLPLVFTTLWLLLVSLSQFFNLDSIFKPQWFPCCLLPDQLSHKIYNLSPLTVDESARVFEFLYLYSWEEIIFIRRERCGASFIVRILESSMAFWQGLSLLKRVSS